MNKLTEKERKELYQYARRIGFIITSFSDYPEHKQIKKLFQYFKKGYRIVDYKTEFKVININDDWNDRIAKNIADWFNKNWHKNKETDWTF